MTPAHSANKVKPLFTVLIFLFTSALYITALSNDFVYDDNFVVMENPLIRGGTPISDYFINNVWSFFSEESKSNFYRPLQLVLYRVEYAAFGLNPAPWHLVNLLIHAVNSALVFLLAMSLLPTMKSDSFGGERAGSSPSSLLAVLPAATSALLFALHPANVEPVSWVSSVSDLLFTLFFLSAFLFFIRSRDKASAKAVFYALSLISFLLALFSKETAMAFIPAIFIFDYLYVSKTIRGAFKTLIPFILAAVFYLSIRTYVLGGITQKEVTELSGFVAVINILPLFFAYISKLIMPVNLSVIYEIEVVSSVFTLDFAAGVLLLALFIFLFCFFLKTRVVPISLALIAVPLAPILYIPAVSTGGFAERYLYLSTIGLGLLISFCFIKVVDEVALRHKKSGAGRVRSFNYLVTLSVSFILVLFFIGSLDRMRVWKDDQTLWLNAVLMSPNSAIAHYNAGTVYDKQEKYPEALWHFQNAGRLDRNYSIAFFNIGSIMARSGLYADAVHYYKRAVNIDPDVDEYKMTLAQAYIVGGKPAEAIKVLEKLLTEKPDLKEAAELMKEAKNQL